MTFVGGVIFGLLWGALAALRAHGRLELQRRQHAEEIERRNQEDAVLAAGLALARARADYWRGVAAQLDGARRIALEVLRGCKPGPRERRGLERRSP